VEEGDVSGSASQWVATSSSLTFTARGEAAPTAVSERHLYPYHQDGRRGGKLHPRGDGGDPSGPRRCCEAAGETGAQARAGDCRCRRTTIAENSLQENDADHEAQEEGGA